MNNALEIPFLIVLFLYLGLKNSMFKINIGSVSCLLEETDKKHFMSCNAIHIREKYELHFSSSA